MDAQSAMATLNDMDCHFVGRRREAEVIMASLVAGRHLLLEGPPGTGKSTVLRALSNVSNWDMEFVEGNADLTPARLLGHFDPAQVLESGYVPDIWMDGPLMRAVRSGSLLYVEEINRVPEETLNLLVTVMSEAELTIPRMGRFRAEPSFRVVAAMNPFDSIGTARISGAVYDRLCRIMMDYQSESEERAIVARASTRNGEGPELDGPSVDKVINDAVAVVRLSRQSPELKVGSSVRGAIDLVSLAVVLADIRKVGLSDADVGLDAALAALSGRVQVDESSLRTAEEIVTELWRHVTSEPAASAGDSNQGATDGNEAAPPGKAPTRTG